MTGVTIMEAPTGYWRAKTVAQVLGVRTGTVQRWVRSQRLPAVKFYGVYLIHEDILKDFVTSYGTGKKPWDWVEGVLEEIFPEGITLLSWSDRFEEIFPDGLNL